MIAVFRMHERNPLPRGARTQIPRRADLMRARHRLSKMLLRRDLRWAGPGSAWTQRHMSWLRSLRFEDICSQATFVDYLSGVEMLVARRAALLAALEQVIPDSRHAPTIARLRETLNAGRKR